METLKDFLIWYNLQDVGPFHKAIDNLAGFYRERSIDAFKDGISLPGLTLKYMFSLNLAATFAIPDEKTYHLL